MRDWGFERLFEPGLLLGALNFLEGRGAHRLSTECSDYHLMSVSESADDTSRMLWILHDEANRINKISRYQIFLHRTKAKYLLPRHQTLTPSLCNTLA